MTRTESFVAAESSSGASFGLCFRELFEACPNLICREGETQQRWFFDDSEKIWKRRPILLLLSRHTKCEHNPESDHEAEIKYSDEYTAESETDSKDTSDDDEDENEDSGTDDNVRPGQGSVHEDNPKELGGVDESVWDEHKDVDRGLPYGPQNVQEGVLDKHEDDDDSSTKSDADDINSILDYY